MILRRFMQHVRDQNWFAVGIDVLVVFGSVLLATQIAVAIEDAKTRRDLNASMRNLSAEISRQSVWTQSAIDWQKRKMKRLREALEILDGANPDDFDQTEIFNALTFGIDAPYLTGDYPTLDEMISTGRFKDIPHKELQSLLIEFMYFARQSDDDNQRTSSLADRSPMYYDFIEWKLDLDPDPKGWGISKISRVDWERARSSKDFRDRLHQAHSVMARTAEIMSWTIGLAEETLAELGRAGYEASESWILKNDWAVYEDRKWYEDE